MRRFAAASGMARETRLATADLVLPLFVIEGRESEREIPPMPGHRQRSVDRLDSEIDEVGSLGVPAVLLFGIPDRKDPEGSGAWNAVGPVPRAIAHIKRRTPELRVIADVCLCEYTDHGHCGLVRGSGEEMEVLNDETLPLLARAAVAYADAGADMVAPSAMMDHQVAALRDALDAAGHGHIPILSYSAKFASAFYGPFRVAAGSTPRFGDRRGYQMDPANSREAMREVQLDVEEGVDVVMIKPAGPYLDIIRQVRDRVELPVAAYQVSGEYAMLKAAAERGWIEERRAALESLTAIKRAGADIIISYYAKLAASWLHDA
ncbi:MAG: porphobilinogen synthase [Gemmatimonadota bacterium]|nr:porphobilinogen synthase [Gemmatimonadota bacterium]